MYIRYNIYILFKILWNILYRIYKCILNILCNIQEDNILPTSDSTHAHALKVFNTIGEKSLC